VDLKFESVLKKYQDRIASLMHANVLLECQIEQMQEQMQEQEKGEVQSNGHGDVKPEVLTQAEG